MQLLLLSEATAALSLSMLIPGRWIDDDDDDDDDGDDDESE